MTNSPTYIEETWWEVTLTTGLILTLPAPLRSTREPMTLAYQPPAPLVPMEVLVDRRPVYSESAITGKSYALDPTTAVMIKTTTIKADPERYQRAVLKAASSATFSSFGLTPESPSDDQENPRGPSTGGTTKRRTH